MRKKFKNKKGFTLIELIVVIAILGILAAIAIPRLSGFSDRANSTQALVEAKNIATAFDILITEGKSLADIEANNYKILVDLAGPDIDAAAISNISIDETTKRGQFTYYVDKGDKRHTITRNAEGEFTQETGDIPADGS